MALYECTFIVRQDATTQEVEKITSNLSNVITEKSGKIHKSENWGLRSLAYEIKRNKKGHYIMLQIEANNDSMKEMERRMKLTEDVIRHLTIKVDSLNKEDSIIMKERNKETEGAA
ncbi:MAG: 30S ribosomal protein S6 [Rickettsiales bacterium]